MDTYGESRRPDDVKLGGRSGDHEQDPYGMPSICMKETKSNDLIV